MRSRLLAITKDRIATRFFRAVHPKHTLAAQVCALGAVAVLGMTVVGPARDPMPSDGTQRTVPVFSANRIRTRTTVSRALPPHWDQIRKLAGPFARTVLQAAKQAHISARLLAAVIQVENGGNFRGSDTRVSSAGAIGVMQLEPRTAWDVLRVNPWRPRQNILGGARYLKMLLRRFGGKARLALMAYNAGPTFVANGGRLTEANAYARKVLHYAFA